MKLGAYGVIVVCGLGLLVSYELPGDIRYRPLIRAAARSPRAEGYGDGGMSSFITCLVTTDHAPSSQSFYCSYVP